MATSTAAGSSAAITSATGGAGLAAGDSSSSLSVSPKKDALSQIGVGVPIVKDTRRRVKIYALNDKRTWEDQGTGHVTCAYSDRLQGLALTVRSESDNSIALESKILPDTSYQKQQETLIVWSEGENCDLALSFQEKVGCEEIWERICHVQGRDPSVDVTQDTNYDGESEYNAGSPDNRVTCSTSAASSTSSQHSDSLTIHLPPCELSRLQEVNDLISQSFATAQSREALVQAIEAQSYIKKLLDLFRMCEDLDNRDSLHLLYRIVMNIFMLNKNALFEILFSDEHLKDVVGVFEYDPSAVGSYGGGQREGDSRKHREYLWDTATFKEVIPMGNPDLKAKIHQTYRVQYIQDFILPAPSIFEENLLSTLSSFIFFNKVEIVSMIQEDGAFLAELFDRLTSKTTSIEHKRDLSSFLKEFCSFSQKLQPQACDNFFRGLASHGVLRALENCFQTCDDKTRLNAIEILGHLVDYNASLIRDYALQQTRNLSVVPSTIYSSTMNTKRASLLNMIIDQIFYDDKQDPEIAAALQVASALKIIIDPDNMMASVPKSDKSEFLAFFYKNCLGNLTELLQRSMVSNPNFDEPKLKNDDYRTAQILSVVLDLLTFCIEHHSFQMRTYVINKNLLKPVLNLLKSKHKFLALGSLRLFRRVVNLKDDLYNAHIVRERLMEQVAKCFKANGPRYNLLNSALLELMEFIRMEDVQMLVADICENYMHYFNDVNYVKTFTALKLRYEQSLERRKSAAGGVSSTSKFSSVTSSTLMTSAMFTSSGDGIAGSFESVSAAAEERWFDDDDTEEAEVAAPSSASIPAPAVDEWDDVVVGGYVDDEDDDVELPSNISRAAIKDGGWQTSALSSGKSLAKGDFEGPKLSRSTTISDQSDDDFVPRPILRPLTQSGQSAVDSPRQLLSQQRQKIVIKAIMSPNLNAVSTAATSNLNAEGVKSPSPSADAKGVARSVSPLAGLRKGLVDYDDDSDEDEEQANANTDRTTVAASSTHVLSTSPISLNINQRDSMDDTNTNIGADFITESNNSKAVMCAEGAVEPPAKKNKID